MHWGSDDLEALAGTEEVRLRTRRRDGTLRSPRIIWVVTDGDRVFIRSTNGRGADWFRWALATGAGQLLVGDGTHDVRFTEVQDEAELQAADAGYRDKYARYASIVDHLLEVGPRAATLEVLPA